MARKVVIDSDSGVCETIALALALADPDLEVLAITPVAGVVDARQASLNAQAVIESLDPSKRPRVGRAVVDELGQAVAFNGSRRLNGAAGLGDLDLSVAELHHVPESSRLLVELVREFPHEVSLITLGPLSNLQAACERTPDFLEQLGQLICLGGTLSGVGDVTASAELNVYGNPEAARRVLRSSPTKLIVPRDIAQGFMLSFERLQRLDLPASPFQRLVNPLLQFALRAHHQHLGLEGIRLEEFVPLSCLLAPELFRTREMSCDVEVSGELTRGMVVFDRRSPPDCMPNAEVVVDLDHEQLTARFERLLQSACQ